MSETFKPKEGDSMNFEDLKSPELQEKLKSAKTPEELLALVKEEGFELPDGELDAIAGGSWSDICWDHCVGPYGNCPDDWSCWRY